MKYSIQTLNKISKAGTDRFCDAYTISDDAKDPDAILVRSASLHDTSFGDNLKAIARAGAGAALEKLTLPAAVFFKGLVLAGADVTACVSVWKIPNMHTHTTPNTVSKKCQEQKQRNVSLFKRPLRFFRRICL